MANANSPTMARVRRLLLLALLLMAACAREPDEKLIRDAINEMEQAVQKRQSKPVMRHLARDFRGPGQMDRRQVRQLMAAHYFRNRNIHVVLAGMRIQVNGNHAEARFNAAVAGGMTTLPQRLQYYDVNTDWRKIDGDWRIVRAHWSPAGQG